jgi:epoxide hydrolase-like predicted phosphatase
MSIHSHDIGSGDYRLTGRLRAVSIEAVLFDIGGVLELTPPTGWQERWAAALGLRPAEFEARLDPIFLAGSTGASTLSEVEHAIAAALRLDAEALGLFMDDLWTEYLGTLNQDLTDYFAGLRPRFRTGIISNSFVGAREREQDRYGFGDLCDVVVYSHEEGVLKPDPRSYRVACARLDVDPTKCVLLDDTQACVDGARAVGMHAVKYTMASQAVRDLEELLG